MIYLLLVILALLWGLSFLGTQVLLEVLAPMEILAVRWFLAFLVFSVLIVLKIIKVNYRGKPLKILLLLTVLQPCLYSILETWGVKLTTSSESSIFIALVPLMVVIENWLIFKQKSSRKVAGAILLSFAGVMVCVVFGPDFSVGSKMLGYLVLIGAVVSGGAYTVCAKRYMAEFSPMEVTYGLTIAGALVFNVLSLLEGNGFRGYQMLFTDWETGAALLYLGVGCSCVAYMIFNYSISRLKVAVAATIQTNAITVVGVLAGIVLGGEPWGWYTIVGMTMTITGIVISSQDEKKSPQLQEN